jgi:hypothetical protein
MMAARLEGNMDGCAPREISGLTQGVNLRVRFARALVPAFADGHPVAHDHTPDAGIGRCSEETALRQTKGAGHESVILGVRHFSASGDAAPAFALPRWRP